MPPCLPGLSRHALHSELQVGKTLRVGGWVKTGREAGAGAFAFLEVNDGSCFDSIQASAAAVCSSKHTSCISCTRAAAWFLGLAGRCFEAG